MIEAVESGALVVVVAADEREEEEERSVVAIAWIAALDTSMSSTRHGSWATLCRACYEARQAKERLTVIRPSDDDNGVARALHIDMDMVDTARQTRVDNRTGWHRSEDRILSRIDKSKAESQTAKMGQRTEENNNGSSHRNQRRLIFLNSQLPGLVDHSLRWR
jgi:hypothetical protein